MKKRHYMTLILLCILVGLTIFVGINYDDAYYLADPFRLKNQTMDLYRDDFGHYYKLFVFTIVVFLDFIMLYSMNKSRKQELYVRSGNSYEAIKNPEYKSGARFFQLLSMLYLTLVSLDEVYLAFSLADNAMAYSVIETVILTSTWYGILIILILNIFTELYAYRKHVEFVKSH